MRKILTTAGVAFAAAATVVTGTGAAQATLDPSAAEPSSATFHSVWSDFPTCEWRGDLGIANGEWGSYACVFPGFNAQYPVDLYVESGSDV
jgi:hypothetical protein